VLKPEAKHLGGAVAAVSVTSAGTVSFPYFTGRLMDGFAQSTQSPELWLELVNDNALACVSALLLVGGGGFARAYLLETASDKISRRLRLELFESILRKPQSFFDASKTGDLVSRLGSDVTRVSRSVMDGAFGFRVLLNAIAGTAMIAKTVPLILVPELLAPVVAMFIGGVIYGRIVRSIARKQAEEMGKSLHIAEENLSLIKIVKLFNGENRAIMDYKKSLDSVYSLAQSNALATGGKVTAFVTIGGGFILHVIYNCGTLISTGTLTIGQTSALAGYLLVCGNAYQGLVTAYGDIQKALGACERVRSLVTRDEQDKKFHPVIFDTASSPPTVRFENVSFRYPTSPSQDLILGDLNLFVPSGAKQAIVGLSGCGKSSILMLLARMYDPLTGKIFIDNHDVLEYDGPTVREKYMSFVPQETALFNNTISSNISYPNDNLERETFLRESARLNFGDWNGLSVGERGQNLSGGERQRIAIARALAKNKSLLLLDEATSALDRESDCIILSNLAKLPQTVLAVTHRMSAIEWSDRLSVVANGRVVQEGETGHLLRNPGPDLQKLLAQIEKDSS